MVDPFPGLVDLEVKWWGGFGGHFLVLLCPYSQFFPARLGTAAGWGLLMNGFESEQVCLRAGQGVVSMPRGYMGHPRLPSDPLKSLP